jgi:hypothetical protein
LLVVRDEKTDLFLVAETVPGHGDVTGPVYNIDEAVNCVGKIVTVDSDVVGIFGNGVGSPKDGSSGAHHKGFH